MGDWLRMEGVRRGGRRGDSRRSRGSQFLSWTLGDPVGMSMGVMVGVFDLDYWGHGWIADLEGAQR